MPTDRGLSFDPTGLHAWDVIFPRDALIYPPSWKLWVCVQPALLWFMRISTERYTDGCVLLPRAHHPFLDRDSHMGCWGDLIEMDEASLQLAIAGQGQAERRGVIGQVATLFRPLVVAAIEDANNIRLAPAKRRAILAALTTSA